MESKILMVFILATGAKGFLIIYTACLGITFSYQPSFVSIYTTIILVLDFIDPFTLYGFFSIW
jgi:hypothetical protein